MGAWSPLAKALGDAVEDNAIRNLKGFTDAQHHESWSSDKELENADGAQHDAPQALAVSTSLDRKRAVFNGHMWKDATNGVGQHHVAMAGDDDLPITAAAPKGQSARVIALLRFRSVPMTPNEKKKLGMALDWHLVACGCMNVLVKLFQEAYSSFEVATVIEGANSRAGPPGEVQHEASYHELQGWCATGHTSQASRDPCFFLASPRFEK